MFLSSVKIYSYEIFIMQKSSHHILPVVCLLIVLITFLLLLMLLLLLLLLLFSTLRFRRHRIAVRLCWWTLRKNLRRRTVPTLRFYLISSKNWVVGLISSGLSVKWHQNVALQNLLIALEINDDTTLLLAPGLSNTWWRKVRDGWWLMTSRLRTLPWWQCGRHLSGRLKSEKSFIKNRLL